MIPTDSKIGDIIHLLDDPVAYVNGILTSFVAYRYDPLSSVIRIGTTGDGVAPNYRIEKKSRKRAVTVEGPTKALTVEFTETPSHIFSGRNHRQMAELDDLERGESTWSEATVSFMDLQELLGRLQSSPGIH